MATVILVIHCMLAFAMIGVVLIQKSEGGGLGVGGGGMSGFMTTRGQANLLTRTTSILAVALVVTSSSLSILSSRSHQAGSSILDKVSPVSAPQAPETAPETPSPASPAPADPAAPPVAK
jgi:preprotein translocase subunit SecG